MKFKIPFKNTGGNKNIFNKQELDLGFKLKNLDLFHFIDDLQKPNNSNSNMNIIKASQTKNYYKNLKKNKNSN